MTDKTQTIRSLNDRFRQAVPSACDVPGQVLLTQGIQALCDTDVEPALHLPDLFERIRNYDTFDTDNDPHGEHDFGAFDFQGEKCFWKLDYYNVDLTAGSEDPADVAVTMRVLTIMLASEY